MSESADEDEETKSQAHWTDCAADPLLAAGHLVLHGLVGVRGLLGASETRTLREFVDVELLRRKGQATAEDNTPECSAACAAFERWFGHVRERRRRYDLKLDIKEPVVLDALHSVCAGLGPILEEVLTADATVVELATMISDPGAAQQAYHPDSLLPSLVGAPLITCFIALQDIDAAMGPTRLLPDTHNVESHRRLRDMVSPHRQAYREAADASGCHMGCQAGDAYLMDSRLWHRGGKNASELRRRLLYVTFGVPHCKPVGSTYSILAEMDGQLRMRDYTATV